MNIRTVIAVALLALPVLAGPLEAQERARSTLTVTGEGAATARPDIAIVSVGVVSQAAQAKDALAQNSKAIAEVIAAAKDGGIEPRDIETARVSISPRYLQPAPGSREPAKIGGYEASNSLSVRVRDLEKTGALLDRLVVTGANQIRSVELDVAQPGPHRDAARAASVKDALRKGALYAEAAGVRIVRLISIEEGSAEAPRPLARMSAAPAAGRPNVPIEAGEQEFRATVNVTFEIEAR